MNDMNIFTWMKWHEWSELKRMFWNEWIERNNLATLSSKVVRCCQFFLRFLCEIELSLQSRAHFADHSPDRAAKPRKQRRSSGNRGRPLYPKKHRVLRRRVFSAVNSHVPDRSHFSTTSWWCGWHDDWDDDVVAMMVRQLAIENRP